MRTTRQMSVTLPHDMAYAVRARVESGLYASESEVIRDGLRALLERDRATEAWLRSEVVHTFDAMQGNPARGQTSDEVRAMLDRERKRADAAG